MLENASEREKQVVSRVEKKMMVDRGKDIHSLQKEGVNSIFYPKEEER